MASPQAGELRIALVGKTGAGKSTLGNRLIGSKTFKAGLNAKAVTCRSDLAHTRLHGVDLKVIDTPGFSSYNLKNKDVEYEITKAASFLAPGPHVILLALAIGRITNEDLDVFETFQKLFGEDVYDFLIVVFTHADELEHEEHEQDKPEQQLEQDELENKFRQKFEDYLKTVPDEIKTVIERCKSWCIPVNNREKDVKKNQKEIDALFDLIAEVERENKGKYYQGSLVSQTEDALQTCDAVVRIGLKDSDNARKTTLEAFKEIDPTTNSSKKTEIQKFRVLRKIIFTFQLILGYVMEKLHKLVTCRQAQRQNTTTQKVQLQPV